MSFLGKEYKFERQENFEEFVKALGLPAEQTQGYLNYKPTLQYTKDGDTYTYTSTTAQGKKEVSFKSGVAFDETVAGMKVNTTYTVDGDTITQIQKSDDGVLTITRTFSGNELVVTLKTNKWDGVATRYYKA
ncbi:fatty acid-binding protein 1-like [Spodoptera litura]|uniref:Fatty acid-binding protein 1-like n=1 Tax=Spodoptera litura TaxID=69820 RepID=A0A9J7EN29_SPOLT|nr:fatty acid-binding protein 1-like [Spodoptera litura]